MSGICLDNCLKRVDLVQEKGDMFRLERGSAVKEGSISR
jgi:hypothetical protein